MMSVKVIKKDKEECVREVYFDGIHKSTVTMRYDKNGYVIDEVINHISTEKGGVNDE